MAAYLDSLEKVRALRLKSIAPGHGHLIEDPKPLLQWYIDHRLEREQMVRDALRARVTAKIDALVPEIYTDVAPDRYPVARHTVHAHLLKLASEGLVTGRTLTGKWSAV